MRKLPFLWINAAFVRLIECVLCAGLYSDRSDTISDNPRLLPGRDVETFVEPARPKKFRSAHQFVFHPLPERNPGAFRDFEAYLFLRFGLRGKCAFFDLTRRDDVNRLNLTQ